MTDPHLIETARLTLRPFVAADCGGLHGLLIEPGVRRFLLDDAIVTREWVATAIDESQQRFAAGDRGLWALRSRGRDGADPRGEIIGFCGFRDFFEPPETHLIYAIATEHWGRGLASEAARAVIEHSMGQEGVAQIIAAADEPNTASLRVMEKAGMQFWKRETKAESGFPQIYYRIAKA